MKNNVVAIMQPYFLPYIGYWQLVNSVDTFVIYDDIQYTKKGWINRNRYLLNGNSTVFSLSLKKDSHNLAIRERRLSDEFEKRSESLLRKFEFAYKKAPFYCETMPLFEKCLAQKEQNLFNFLYNTIRYIMAFLSIKTEILFSSGIGIDESLTGKDRIIRICKFLNAGCYINPIGGMELYKKEDFRQEGITLSFLKSRSIVYRQYDENEFIPWLSIIDVLMFNSRETVNKYLVECDYI